MTENLEEARRFYSGVLGYDEVFRHQRAIPARAELSVFKVADEQYIEVAPALQNPRKPGNCATTSPCLQPPLLE